MGDDRGKCGKISTRTKVMVRDRGSTALTTNTEIMGDKSKHSPLIQNRERGRRKSLFLHICCGNCACFPKKILEENDFEITGFWYNPNIHPYSEYQKRLMAAGYFAHRVNLPMIWDLSYDIKEFIANFHGNFTSPQRCSYCYSLRLYKAAETARKNGFRLFSTTLLYSIHQENDLIRSIGKEAAEKYGMEFYDVDYRKGWQEGIEISKKLNLYRQNYCGCMFSEEERYMLEKSRE